MKPPLQPMFPIVVVQSTTSCCDEANVMPFWTWRAASTVAAPAKA